MSRIIYVCNTAGIAARFRKPVFKAALAEGYEVIVICGLGTNAPAHIEELKALGVTVNYLPGLESDGMSVSQLRSQAREIGQIVDKVQPDILHAFTHRANIASYLALRSRQGVRFIPNLTGAGRLFDTDLSLRDRLARQILLRLYRAMGRRCECIFFQNDDDLAEIGGYMQMPRSKLRLTGGSGYDPEDMVRGNAPDIAEFRTNLASMYGIAPEKRLFLFSSRALKSKGVAEFYEAAARYLELFDDAVFVHAGEDSAGPYGMSALELRNLQRPGLHYIGFRNDILQLVDSAFAVVLPSAYREGVPRSLIEALWFGKPILTTDNPGCRETVIDGWNGKIFKPRSVHALLTALVAARDIDDRDAAENSHRLFESRFDAELVARIYLDQYKQKNMIHAPQK